MSLEAKLMLEEVHGVFARETADPEKAWDRLVEFVAVDHNAMILQQLDHKFEWILGNRRFSEDVSRVYNPILLRESQDDVLGSLYRVKFAVREAMGRRVKPSQLELTLTGNKRRPVIVDPAIGTGQNLLAASKKSPKALLFGADSDIRALRLAMTNAAIHDIEGHFLVGDWRVHDLDLKSENGRFNWQQANRWYGPGIKLKRLPGKTAKQPVNQISHNKIQESSKNE